MSKNMKKAAIDQILLWIVLFTIFVSFFFFVLKYSNAIKVKDNTDAVADYLARMIALNKSTTEIITGVNKVKETYFNDVIDTDLTCVDDTTQANYQVVINVYTTLVNEFLPVGNGNVHSKTIVFNESNQYEKECSLTLTFK